jgi:hypothetical protein
MSTMTPAQWFRTTALTEYEVVAFEKAAERTWEYPQIYGDQKKNGPGDQTIKGYLWGAFGYPYEREYGEDIQTEQMSEIGEWELTDVEVALGWEVDDKLLEDMRHITEKEFLNQAGDGIGYSFSQAKCLYAAAPLNRAFSTTNQTMYDGKALCADDHPLYGTGGTIDNKLSAGAPTFSLIWDMLDWHRISQYTHEGLRKPSKGKTFICHDVQQRNVERILTQQYEFDGVIDTTSLGSATDAVSSKNVNNLRNKGINVVYCIELTDTSANFMMGRRAKRNWRFRMRKNLESHWDYNRRNRTRSNFNHMRLMYGVTDHDDFCGRPGS